jgi:hypothetical protein
VPGSELKPVLRNDDLGRVCFEAYCTDRGEKDIPAIPAHQWGSQDPMIRRAWIAAARAVLVAELDAENRPVPTSGPVRKGPVRR